MPLTKEGLSKLASERGWYKILGTAHETHSLFEIAVKLNMKESVLLAELRKMQGFGLMGFVGQVGGVSQYNPTIWGIKLLQEENEAKGRTYRCLICGMTTGLPHICPAFNPEYR